MNGRITVMSLLALAVASFQSERALAQASPSSQDVQVYGGYFFGDRLLETPLSGYRPQLDDNAIFGARYTYHFTDQWGVQLSAGYGPSRATHVPSGDRDLGLTIADLDLEWDITPGYEIADHKLIGYTVVGMGFGWANLSHPIYGVVGTTPVRISDGNGYTANIGFGAKYYLLDNLFVDFDVRYRYLSKLVTNHGQGLNTAVPTLGLGYRF